MEIGYHPLVRQDVLGIIRYYHDISARLADELNDELQAVISKISQNPLRFPPTECGFRRANLKRFPYHVLYEANPERIRVMIVRHNKRHPQFGMDRR